MPREDIVAGLKNALERGEPMQKAMASFINAGYTPAEVEEASKSASGIMPVISQQTGIIKKEEPSAMAESAEKPIKKTSWKIILLITLLVLILAGLGYFAYMLLTGKIAF